MFFIDVGQVDIIQQGSSALIATLEKGDFFGEISVMMNCPRTAHVQSSCVTELFALHDSEMAKLMELYPCFKRMLISVAEDRARQLNEETTEAMGGLKRAATGPVAVRPSDTRLRALSEGCAPVVTQS